jgi:hypothetical protein
MKNTFDKKLFKNNISFFILTFIATPHLIWGQNWSEYGGANSFANSLNTGKIISITTDPLNNNLYVGGVIIDPNNSKNQVIKYNFSQKKWNQAGNLNVSSTDTVFNLKSTRKLGLFAGGSFLPFPSTTIYFARSKNDSFYRNYYIPINQSDRIRNTIFTEDLSGNVYYIMTATKASPFNPGTRGVVPVGVYKINGSTGLAQVITEGIPVPDPFPANFSCSHINAACVDKNGNLYLAGNIFMVFSSDSSQRILKYDGLKWSFLPTSGILTKEIITMTTDSSGNLYVAGLSTNTNNNYYISKFNGSSWSEAGGTNSLRANRKINTLHFDKNNTLYAGGDFTNKNGYRYVAKLTQQGWVELSGKDSLNANGEIKSICSDTFGNILVGGYFTNSFDNSYIAIFQNSNSTGLNSTNINSHLNFKIYPNPVSSIISIEYNGFAQDKNLELNILNSLGQKILQKKIEGVLTQINLPIGIQSGIYFIELSENGNKILHREKIIIN